MQLLPQTTQGEIRTEKSPDWNERNLNNKKKDIEMKEIPTKKILKWKKFLGEQKLGDVHTEKMINDFAMKSIFFFSNLLKKVVSSNLNYFIKF